MAELREAHLRYLLAIYELGKSNPDVGTQAVAKALNCSKASVTKMMATLMDMNLLVREKYGKIYLTDTGFLLAKEMFSIIDSRYRCNKPLIVTTNLKLNELKHPPDLARARIYDRILERCAPILFAGKNFREDNAATTKAAARQIITSTAASHRQTATEKGEL